MTRRQLVQAATDHARSQGWRVDEYTVTDVTTAGKECSVSFTGVSKRPGDHFTVYLECQSGRVLRLIPGR
jgi:hypothetical protein